MRTQANASQRKSTQATASQRKQTRENMSNPTIITPETMHTTEEMLINDQSFLASLVSGDEAGYEAGSESDVGESNEADDGNETKVDEVGDGNEAGDKSDESSDDELELELERRLATLKATRQAKKRLKAQIKTLKLTNLKAEQNVHTASTDLLAAEEGLTAANATLEAANATFKEANVKLKTANARLDVVNLAAESSCKYLAETKQTIQRLQSDLEKAQQERKEAEDAANKAKVDAESVEIEAKEMQSKYNDSNAEAQRAANDANTLLKAKNTAANALMKAREHKEVTASDLKKAEGELASLKAPKESISDQENEVSKIVFDTEGDDVHKIMFGSESESSKTQKIDEGGIYESDSSTQEDDDGGRYADALESFPHSDVGDCDTKCFGESDSDGKTETESDNEHESEHINLEKCSECDCSPTETLININGKRVCNQCHSDFKKCSICDRLKIQKKWHQIDGQNVCDQCKCPQCQQFIEPHNHTNHDGKVFCSASCFELFCKVEREKAYAARFPQRNKETSTVLEETSTVLRRSKRKSSTQKESKARKRLKNSSSKEMIRCPHCPHTVPHDRTHDLEDHIRTQHQKKRLLYRCYGCPHIFGDTKRFNLRCYEKITLEHTHGNELTTDHILVPHYKCPCCDAEYDKKSNLIKHLNAFDWHNKQEIVLETKLGKKGEKWGVAGAFTRAFAAKSSVRV